MSTYRAELQGLRALAVVLVVVYHVWINRVSGGVDVFFLLSGFLLTGQLVRAAERGAVDVPRRWSRTLMRLTPAAVIVLAGTVVASAVVLPAGRWPQTVREIAAAALYLENWQLAADTVDYAARNNMTSVVQHFWSLSIQGQFFLIWPPLIALVALASRGAVEQFRRNTTLVLLGVFASSLAYSVELTALQQPLAYFHTLTRLWEFALGGLLALHADRIVLSARARLAAGWAGVLGLVVCGIALPVGSVFPGFAALWPTGCAALVLLAGRTGAPAAADRLLGGRPARYVGDISYALYLWHWPVLILYLAARQEETVGLGGGALVIGVSVVLAVLTHHLVERPVLKRPSRVRTGYWSAAVGTSAVLLLLVAVWQVIGTQHGDSAAQLGDEAHPGAHALLTEAVEPAPLLPPPVSVFEDWVRIEHWNCAPMAAFPMDVCAQPLPAEAAEGQDTTAPPARRIVVVGDSHAQQLTGALIPIAQQNNWQLITIIRGACPFSTASEVVPEEADCLAWNSAAADEITTLRPDAVVTLASRDVRAGLTEQTPLGFVEQWRRLDAQGIPVMALRDNPRFDHSIPDCVQNRLDSMDECGIARSEVYAPVPPWTALPDLPSNVTFVDIADAVCDPDRCPAVIGNVLVYLDDNHLTATYSTSMADLLADQVHTALGW
ncbi:acyltransferase family protein [Pseudonocardia xinjiangensis]|uniref:acyltransferase family protein n=1 Tax=Pseudonocardia xinjiangensis TaxID=75289 RepID=UPI003D9111B5